MLFDLDDTLLNRDITQHSHGGPLTRPLVAKRNFEEANSGDNPANLAASRPAASCLKVLGFGNTETLSEIRANFCKS